MKSYGSSSPPGPRGGGRTPPGVNPGSFSHIDCMDVGLEGRRPARMPLSISGPCGWQAQGQTRLVNPVDWHLVEIDGDAATSSTGQVHRIECLVSSAHLLLALEEGDPGDHDGGHDAHPGPPAGTSPRLARRGDRRGPCADGRTAWAQTGVTAGDYTKATGEHGLATGLGDTPSVGLGGITLSGGIGFLVRKNGLTIDDLLAAELVTADGELLEVDDESHADLFWALRGGGGNFGVATRLRFRLHEIDEVVGGMLLLPASTEVITGLVAAAEAAPEELSVIANAIKAPPLPFIPTESHGKPVVIALMVYAGDADAGERAIAPIRALATPLADMVRPIRYPEMYAGPEGPRAVFAAGTNVLIDAFATGAAEAILEHLETSAAPMAGIQLRVLGGAMARVPDDATAFGHRGATMMVNIAAMYESPEDAPEHEAWASNLATALSDGTAAAAYVGFLGDEGEEGVRRAYPTATLERLAEVKRRYDPDNLFRLNLNVPRDAT
jgi:FAD/FMN-containing dehydrogenase